MKEFDLTGKVAIITGSSKGIGKSIAKGLAQHGAKVVISSRKLDAVNAVVEEFKNEGLALVGIPCHVGDSDQRKSLIQQTIDHFGGVDILVNNAATNPTFGPIHEAEEVVFDKIMDVNVKACMVLANLCLPSMQARGGGSIINIASVEGMKPSPGLGMYSISKAALIMLSKTQAVEWGPLGIRSNTICPGLVKTKFSAALWQNEEILNKVTKQLPSKRMAHADEMAGIAVFLASDAASYCTGGIYTADGGYMVA
ncbi:MAG: glucose 1-dehydrogenase [Bacteroidota bacterium]